jgi:hypothetical protein
MAGIPTLADLRTRFNEGLISQEQYNLEQKAIMKDMSEGARRNLHRRKLRARGEWAEERSRQVAKALEPADATMAAASFLSEPNWHMESSFNITFDDTFNERDTQDASKQKRANHDAYYRGVTWNAAKQRWTARLLADGKSLSIGYFMKEEDAVAASDVYQTAKWSNA